ncbi:MAG: lytic murein transglycosylase [Candidatus Pacebacteria bacterium]|nr:lytic murein transglycosylase [Candidatus Paceibacterota bacterium]
MRVFNFSLLIIFLSLVLPFSISADNDMAQKCLSLSEKGCQTDDVSLCRKELEECEEYYNLESQKIAADITKTQAEKNTLQNKIYTINSKIKNLNYQISQSNLIIKDLGYQVKDTQDSITNTSLKIEDSKEKLKKILRTIYEEDQKPVIEILLSGKDLSDFFDNLVALELLNSKNKNLLQDIKILKLNLENQKISLDSEKDDLERTVKIQTLQRDENSKTKKEQEYYLNITEQEYNKQIQQKKEADQKAASIRARIFELIGVSKAPTFAEALEIAKYAESVTGIRPAFLLAILTQESNIGKNVGQCYVKNFSTGEGIRISGSGTLIKVMSPTRDVSYFLSITKELGRDPANTPVSCPLSYGWGGAMGPAQFIPSTWVNYRDRVKAITGKPADPWGIKDAFLASALHLTDYGAAKRTTTGEWNSAMIYFSGTTQRTKYNGYGFYGDSVMNIAKRYEEDIKAIE